MKLELLAPAGRWESMVAAVQNGADAIYLGGEAFNARRQAGNFSAGELREAVAYCHLRSVHVHVTCNTLLLDRELAKALDYVAELYEIGVDALIVQDLGLIRILRSQFPEFSLHASTQLAIHDEAGLRMCERLGIGRAVLARELSLARIRVLGRQTEVELECFAHGALCTAVSGLCLFSSLAGGQSGNRGMCKQPCRKIYAVDGGQAGYPLSLEDLCMLFHVRELADAGVRSIKLEGRMKRPEYVSAMTRAYRMAIDGAPKEDLEREWSDMQRIFSRGGGTGYYFKSPATQMRAGRHSELKDSDAQLQKERERYAVERRQYPIDARLSLRVEEPARLAVTCRGITVDVEGEVAAPARKEPEKERFLAQIAKLGGTLFVLREFELDMEAPAYLPVAALNAMRREAVGLLQEKLSGRRARITGVRLPDDKKGKPSGETKILAILPDAVSAERAFLAGADWVALSPSNEKEAEGMLLQLQRWRKERKLLLQLPAADLHGGGWEALFETDLLDGGIAQNAAQAERIRGTRIAGYLCNAANGQAIAQLRELGFDYVLLSLELNRGQLSGLLAHAGTGMVGYGRAQLMQLMHCPAKEESGCVGCEGSHSLTDEAGRVFPLEPVKSMAGACLVRVRNCEVMDILDLIAALPAPELLALEFDACSQLDEIENRVGAARMAMRGEMPTRLGGTKGHWARGWE